MKKWIQKLIEQFDLAPSKDAPATSSIPSSMTEERATLLFMIDTLNKHLIEMEQHPLRKTRDVLDEFAKDLLRADGDGLERTLFRFRQFFSTYRIDEYAYMQKTLDDFRGIIWDFVDQLSEDWRQSDNEDDEIQENLMELREAVEANSIDILKTQSRRFIDFYVEYQFRRDQRKNERFQAIKKNLNIVKKKLVEANQSIRLDHLTGANNRKSFDDQLQQTWSLFSLAKNPVTLVILDIDHFKRINDTYGHAIGDFILQQLVLIMKEQFQRDEDFIARLGGEEFAVLMSSTNTEVAVKRIEAALEKIRSEVFVAGEQKIRFTVSAGIAQLLESETTTSWLKRADEALYKSKNSGRDRYSVATPVPHLTQVA